MNRTNIWNILDNKILPLVQKPGRYIGGEINSVNKELSNVKVRIALVFPDIYEVGMSNLGLKILYEEINSRDDFFAERVFCPWTDMEKYMRKYNIPAFSLETHSQIKEFDIVGFSLQHELCYTNVLNILDLAGIPFKSENRMKGDFPLIIAGGLMSYMPEPVADFFDLFVIGDGEDIVIKIMEFYGKYGKEMTKEKFLEKIAQELDCVYVPSLYNTYPDKEGRLSVIKPKTDGTPARIKKHVIHDFEKRKAPERFIVPLIEIVHDRASVEIMRGCPRPCRFCQAGVLYRPVRKRNIKNILDCAKRCIENTGYGEIGLLSLSSTDFGGIDGLADQLLKMWDDRKVSISMPSMRLDSFNLELIDRISNVKKTGITLAPEAASRKLLDIINKGYKPEDIIEIAGKAHGLGYRLIKLYFMIGIPGEEKDDLADLLNILYKISRIGFSQINVSVSTLIPKPHTPFQWIEMIDIKTIKEKQDYLRNNIKDRRIRIKFHNRHITMLEALFNRGDRRFADVIYAAWKYGARFDQWDECFDFGIWEKAFSDCAIDINKYLSFRNYDEPLPWDHIDSGIEKEVLKKECESACLPAGGKVLNKY